jgi:hypothetical protein
MNNCSKCGHEPQKEENKDNCIITCNHCKDRYVYDNVEDAVNKWNLRNKR